MEFIFGLKKYIYAGIALLVIILASTAYFLYKQSLKEAGNAAVATSVNQGNTEVAKKKDEGDRITSSINEQNTQKQEDNHNATEGIIAVAVEKKKKAEQVFQASAKTPEAVTQRDTSIDSADIDSLWNVFCAGQPTHPQCPKVEVAK